jgi:hypothetical protein
MREVYRWRHIFRGTAMTHIDDKHGQNPPETHLPSEEQTRNLTAEHRSEQMRHEHPVPKERDPGRDVSKSGTQPESPMQEKQRLQTEEQQKNLRGVPKAPAEPPQKEPEGQIIMSFFEQEVPVPPPPDGTSDIPTTEKKLFVRIYAGEFSRVVREATDEDKTANQAAYQEFVDKQGYEAWKAEQAAQAPQTHPATAPHHADDTHKTHK